MNTRSTETPVWPEASGAAGRGAGFRLAPGLRAVFVFATEGSGTSELSRPLYFDVAPGFGWRRGFGGNKNSRFSALTENERWCPG